jgi:hypothetical protein
VCEREREIKWRERERERKWGERERERRENECQRQTDGEREIGRVKKERIGERGRGGYEAVFQAPILSKRRRDLRTVYCSQMPPTVYLQGSLSCCIIFAS